MNGNFFFWFNPYYKLSIGCYVFQFNSYLLLFTKILMRETDVCLPKCYNEIDKLEKANFLIFIFNSSRCRTRLGTVMFQGILKLTQIKIVYCIYAELSIQLYLDH